MKKMVCDKRGFTTSEILMAALFGGIVMATLYGFYRDQLFRLLSQETKIETLEDARGTLDLMIRELRNAGSWGTGTAPAGCSKVVNATATTIHIQADLNDDGDCDDATSDETGEDVTYDLLSGGTSTCPGPRIRRNLNCLVANVVIPSGSDFLTYYSDGSVTPLGHPIADLTAIRRIKITFSVQVANPDPRIGGSISSTLSSSMVFRN